jgi:mannose-6-phosphate isomerase-like protein (cupin superfamily)
MTRQTVFRLTIYSYQAKKPQIVGHSRKTLAGKPYGIAPDGSSVRILLGLKGGCVAHFELPPGQTLRSVTHQTGDEIWYFLSGRGQMWRQEGDKTEIVDVYPGVCLAIPLGTHFQSRSYGFESLAAVGATMPPWPGGGEAITVTGPWQPTLT